MTTLQATSPIARPRLLPLIRSARLAELPWLRHGVTTRVPGLGLAEGNVGYTAPRDVEDAWDMRVAWTDAIGLDPDRIVRVRQVHGDGVAVATDEDGLRGGRPEASEAPIADAIVSNVPGLALMTLHADCLPILLADVGRRAVAAIHAGWRGTLLDVAGATVGRMTAEYGTDPSDLVAFIGPGISCGAFEVGDEVAEAFEDRWPETATVVRDGPRPRLDLKRLNALQLRSMGVPPEAIEVSPLCTVSDERQLFSHRAQGAHTGRFAAVIGIVQDGQVR